METLTKAGVQIDFLRKVERAANAATDKHKRYRVCHREDQLHKWLEHKLVAEVYHELREEGIDSDFLSVEQPPPGGGRRYFDLAYLPNCNSQSLENCYIQIIAFEDRLYVSKHTDDFEAFSRLPSKEIMMVSVFVRYGADQTGYGDGVKEKLEGFKDMYPRMKYVRAPSNGWGEWKITSSYEWEGWKTNGKTK